MSFYLSSIPKCSSTFYLFFVQHPKMQQHVFLFCPASQSAAARFSLSSIPKNSSTSFCFDQHSKVQQHVYLFFVQHPKMQQHVFFVLSSIPKRSSTFFFVQHPKNQQHVCPVLLCVGRGQRACKQATCTPFYRHVFCSAVCVVCRGQAV